MREMGDDTIEIEATEGASLVVLPTGNSALAVPAPPTVRYGVRSLGQMLAGVFDAAQQPRSPGVPSGHAVLDRLLGGFRPQMVTVFGAGTSFGKSSFAVMTTDVGMRAGARVLLVSAEDSEAVYGARFMARRARVNALQLRDGRVGPRDLDRMATVVEEAEREPFFLTGIGKPVEYLAVAIREIVKEAGIDLVLVDYLQAITTTKRTQDRRNEITHIARTLIDAIKVSGASGIIFSQLKRTEDGRPSMHDLKESGDLENMAEHVLIGYRTRDKTTGEERRYVLVEKNKDGPVVAEPIEMPFNPVTASFEETR